jgi:hypothetical protein
MVVKVRILFDPFHRRFSFTGGQRCLSFLMGHSLHISGREGGGLESVTMSMVYKKEAPLVILFINLDDNITLVFVGLW